MGRSPRIPAQGAEAGRGQLRVCGGLALARRLLLVEPRQGVQPLFWSNSTNWGCILQHKRVRKPSCYCKKLKSLLRMAQLIFSDLVLSNTASVSYGDSETFFMPQPLEIWGEKGRHPAINTLCFRLLLPNEQNPWASQEWCAGAAETLNASWGSWWFSLRETTMDQLKKKLEEETALCPDHTPF